MDSAIKLNRKPKQIVKGVFLQPNPSSTLDRLHLFSGFHNAVLKGCNKKLYNLGLAQQFYRVIKA